MLLTITTSTPSNASALSNLISFLDRYQENITTAIAIFGFILSLGQLLYTLYRRREKYSMEIQAIKSTQIQVTDDPEHPEKDNHVFFCTIINYSALPIVLTKIFIYDSAGNKYPCRLRSTWVGEVYHPKFPETDIPRTERKLSVEFPICIGAEQARNESIVFKLPRDTKIINEGLVSLEIHTINKVSRFTLNCPIDSLGPLAI